MKTSKRVRRPLPVDKLFSQGGHLALIVERDPRPAYSGVLNVTRVYWNGRRYQVPRTWRRFL